jgi:hypothetical protein
VGENWVARRGTIGLFPGSTNFCQCFIGYLPCGWQLGCSAGNNIRFVNPRGVVFPWTNPRENNFPLRLTKLDVSLHRGPWLYVILHKTKIGLWLWWLVAGLWFSLGTPIFSTNKYSWNIVESGVKHHNHNPIFVLCKITYNHGPLTALCVGKHPDLSTLRGLFSPSGWQIWMFPYTEGRNCILLFIVKVIRLVDL